MFLEFVLSVLVAATGTSPSAANSANPLELAEKGLLQCWHPNRVNRTCQAIISYRKTGLRTYDHTSVVLVSSYGPLTVETQAPVFVRDDAVCDTIRTEEIEAGTLREGGHILAPAEAAGILRQIAERVAPFEGQKTCTRYERSGDDFIAKVWVSGKYKSELDMDVKWITPADGYSVKP